MNQKRISRKFDALFQELFTAFGLRPVKQSKMSNFLIFIINFIFQASIFGSFLLGGNLFISVDPLSKFTDIIELFGPVGVFLINLILFFKNRKILLKVEKIRESLDAELRGYDSNFFWDVYNRKMFSFLLKFFIIQFVGIGIEMFQIITLRITDPAWKDAIQTRLFALNMNRFMYIEFMYYCDYISSRLEILNHLRIQILDQNSSDEQKVLKNLKKIKTFDLDIIKMIQLIRDYFKWMLLLNITVDVICIIVDLYWIYGGFIFGNNPNFAQSCSCPWGKVVSIIVLFYSCNDIQIQRDNSLAKVFEWNSEFDSITNSKRRFFLQHIHSSKFVFDANGFFYINYGVLIGIVEAITIYMVYFFQFMSENNIFSAAIERNEKPSETEIKP